MRKCASIIPVVLLLAVVLSTGCAVDPPPAETTADGLVRVAARSAAGVYRAPDATFIRYQRVILEAPSISFYEFWARNHPEVNAAELARLRAETVELFREEFTRQVVKRGPYEFADELAPDVLLVIPTIEDLDIRAPEAGTGSIVVGRPVTMKVTGDLRDAVTGKLVGRVITYLPPEQYPNMRSVARPVNTQEQRRVFANWSQVVREAIDVAKAAKPADAATLRPRDKGSEREVVDAAFPAFR